jgi:hypothetical protein
MTGARVALPSALLHCWFVLCQLAHMMRERFSAPPHLFLQPPKPTASKRAVKAAQRQKNAPELETIWQETTDKGFLLVYIDQWGSVQSKRISDF